MGSGFQSTGDERRWPSLYLALAEPAVALGEAGRTVKTQTIETSDESVSPLEPPPGGGS